MKQAITYPQYRKYKNGLGFFKIISEKEWEEIQVIGSKYLFNTFQVNIFPDRNFLYDMTFDYSQNWIVIDEAEYNEVRIKVRKLES